VAGIRLEHVSKTYPGGHPALVDVDLEVADGELLVLVGPSGCGKSTALRIVAGLESPSSGRVWIGGRDVTELAPGRRDVAMVFQSYALYPHKNVRENLAFALRVRGVPAAERTRRIERVAAQLGLLPILERRPAQLSGGQRQRVALGRALVREPRAFLLDEPLSNLDARLRLDTRAELARLHDDLAATIVYVTHDQEEAMTLGDRIAVLREGRIEQVGSPLELWQRPATEFVADFIGSPRMNWFDARVEEAGAAPMIHAGAFALPAPPLGPGSRRGPLRLGIRPHDVSLVEPGAGDALGRVEVVQSLGSGRLVWALLEGAARVCVVDAGEAPLASGAAVGLRFARERFHLFDPQSGARIGGAAR
jgi:ABC-type sugar transport system ATPase subunit